MWIWICEPLLGTYMRNCVFSRSAIIRVYIRTRVWPERSIKKSNSLLLLHLQAGRALSARRVFGQSEMGDGTAPVACEYVS